jgi:chemotaxis protein MotB
MSTPKDKRPIIVVKRRKTAAGHHGGAWKVAYADFVTAMMAFFMVMWLVTAVNKEQRAAMFEYFKNPSMQDGKSVKAAPGSMGPGGASTAVINLGGGLDAPKPTAAKGHEVGEDNQDKAKSNAPPSPEQAAKLAAEAERARMQVLMDQLREAIEGSEKLRPFKEQLLLDLTPEGLRIQIVDAQNRPMFDLGASNLKVYTADILRELVTYLNSVPNRLSLTGHTDTTPYSRKGYSNWDLSADRANAARRALESGGLSEGKIARIVGLSSSVLFDRDNPRNPINRRISIIVMTRSAEEAATRVDTQVGIDPQAAAAEPAAGGAVADPGKAATADGAAAVAQASGGGEPGNH